MIACGSKISLYKKNLVSKLIITIKIIIACGSTENPLFWCLSPAAQKIPSHKK
jgi:hypothetical protein